MSPNRGNQYDPLEDSDFDNLEDGDEEDEWEEEDEDMVMEEENEPGLNSLISTHDSEKGGTIDNDDYHYHVLDDEDALWTARDRRLA
jgi:hypothetical protein